MKTFKPNNARVVAIAALFLILTACGKGSKQSQAPEKECQAAGVQKDKSISESISIDDEEICPVDPDSPYWYDPKQEEVELSEDGDTLFRFPRIKKGGDYEVPQSVRYIYERAFQGCRNLRSLTVPRTVKHIEMAPFEWTRS